MYEVSLVLMEVDAILWLHIGRDIAPGSLFHIDIFAEVPLLPIEKDRKIRMPVYLIRTGDENIGDANREQNDDDTGENFEKGFHIDWKMNGKFINKYLSFDIILLTSNF